MKLPKAVYPRELSDHQIMFGEYVLVKDNEGKVLAFPCESPWIKRQVLTKIKHSTKLHHYDVKIVLKKGKVK